MSMRILIVASALRIFFFSELLRIVFLLYISCKSRIFYLFLRKMQCAHVAFLYNVLSSALRSRQWQRKTKNKIKAQNAICLCSSNTREKLNKSHLLVQDVLSLSMCKGNRWIMSETKKKKYNESELFSVILLFFLMCMSFYTS